MLCLKCDAHLAAAQAAVHKVRLWIGRLANQCVGQELEALRALNDPSGVSALLSRTDTPPGSKAVNEGLTSRASFEPSCDSSLSQPREHSSRVIPVSVVSVCTITTTSPGSSDPMNRELMEESLRRMHGATTWRAHNPRWSGPFGAQGAHRITVRGE